MTEQLSFGAVALLVAAVVAWLAAVGALLFGGVRRTGRARLLFGAAALAQLLGGPIAVGVAYASMLGHLRAFAAESWTLGMLAQLALAATLGWSAIAVSNVLASFSRDSDT